MATKPRSPRRVASPVLSAGQLALLSRASAQLKLDDFPAFAAYSLQLHCGLRAGECPTVNWDEVQEDDGKASIVVGVRGGARVVPVPLAMIKLLRQGLLLGEGGYVIPRGKLAERQAAVVRVSRWITRVLGPRSPKKSLRNTFIHTAVRKHGVEEALRIAGASKGVTRAMV